MLPTDPYILLSFLNTKLRDEYPSLTELCAALDVDEREITAALAALAAVGCRYDPDRNQFI